MYVTAREMIPAPGEMQKTIAFGSEIVGVPNKVWLSGFWNSLDEYQSFLESYMSDQQMMAAINMSTSFMVDIQDQIGEILRPPGERKAFAQMHRGRLKSTGVAEGTELILELTNHVSELSGSECGLIRPVTGDQYGVMFVAYADSIQGLKDMTDSWVTDEKYQELFTKSPEYFESEFDVTYARFI